MVIRGLFFTKKSKVSPNFIYIKRIRIKNVQKNGGDGIISIWIFYYVCGDVKKATSMSDIVFKNDINLALYKVIKKNKRDDKIAQYSISSGINKYHPSYINYIEKSQGSRNYKKNKYINEKYEYDNDVYKGAYSFPFMSEEEKYIKENFLDKQNWLDKKGFLVSVGKYKMPDNFIPNYVNATPSEPPVNYKFREVKKIKWLNKNGFYL